MPTVGSWGPMSRGTGSVTGSMRSGVADVRRTVGSWTVVLALAVAAAGTFPRPTAVADGPSGDVWVLSDGGQEGCTVGVAGGEVTQDGRPILWKVRDVGSEGRQQLVYVEDSPHSYIGVRSEGGDVYMGLSEAGVASGNSLVRLSSGSASNASVQEHILRSFASVDQIADYFTSEQQAGTCNASGCFPFIDAAGGARIFEVDRSRQLWAYDSLDPARQVQGLHGFVVRANEFHMTDDGTDDAGTGGRYACGVHNILGLIADGALSVRTLVQGRGDSHDDYEFIRYGPGRELSTISRDTTRSAIVVHGTLPDEDPALATMWVLLGQTNYSIAVPTWARVPKLPECLRSGQMYDRAKSLWIKGEEETTQAGIFPVEAHFFDVVTETLLPHWRIHGVPEVPEMIRIETRMADDAYSLLDCLDNRRKDNQAPMLSVSAAADGATLGFTVAAEDSDGAVVTTQWDFGDGWYSSEVSPSHVYGEAGTYLVSCTATDDCGVSVTAWHYVQVAGKADVASREEQGNRL